MPSQLEYIAYSGGPYATLNFVWCGVNVWTMQSMDTFIGIFSLQTRLMHCHIISLIYYCQGFARLGEAVATNASERIKEKKYQDKRILSCCNNI
jgi:hypothetical protein